MKVFQIILKSLENFLICNYCNSNAKNQKLLNKIEKNFDLATDSLIERK